MCGRYLCMDKDDMEEIYKILKNLDKKDAEAKIGEVLPTDKAAVLSLVDNRVALGIMKWGFPKWDGKGVIINAVSETAAEKKMFSKALRTQRCVIPSTGFFEWQKKDNSKEITKYLFNCANNAMLYMAGVYAIYHDGAAVNERFVILTRAANRYISDVHDRMPVILYKDELNTWLKDDRFIDEAFRRDDVPLERMAY